MTEDQNDDSHDDGGPAPDSVIERLEQQMAGYSSTASPDSGAIIPAGHQPPSPASLDDIGVAHAIDGDGAAMCRPHLRLEQVDDCYWNDVPDDQRCNVCAAALSG